MANYCEFRKGIQNYVEKIQIKKKKKMMERQCLIYGESRWDSPQIKHPCLWPFKLDLISSNIQSQSECRFISCKLICILSPLDSIPCVVK